MATASSLPPPSAAAAAPAKTSMAAKETSGFVDQMFTFYLRIDGPAASQDGTRQNCHKRANHPLRCLFAGHPDLPDIAGPQNASKDPRFLSGRGPLARDDGPRLAGSH